MTPQYFKEKNGVFTGGEGVGDLPVYKEDGLIISCWKPTFRERMSVLLFGRVWLSIMSNGLPPIGIEARRSNFDYKKEEA